MESCKNLGLYDNIEIYLWIHPITGARLFYKNRHYFLPKWANPDTLTLIQAVRIIQYRQKKNNYENIDNIDKIISEVKNNNDI